MVRAVDAWSLDEWRNLPGRTRLRSVELCETGTLWRVWGPRLPDGAADLTVQRVRCWSPSCRRCGPLVGAQDLARLRPAIQSKREWIYLVLTMGPDELRAEKGAAEKRNAELWSAWRSTAEGAIGGPPPVLVEAARPWDWWAQDSGARRLETSAEWLAWRDHAAAVVPVPKLEGTTAYHAMRKAFRRFLWRARRAWAPLEYVATWEAHRSGRPHLNVLLSSPRLAAFVKDAGDLGLRSVRDRRRWRRAGEAEERPKRRALFSRRLRQELRTSAMGCGFGGVFWCEIARPESAALAGYVVKLAAELSRPSVKGQTPYNRPRGFRRYDYSRDLVDPRWYPRGAPVPDGCPECDEVHERGEWCTRTLGHHLRTVHGWCTTWTAAELRVHEERAAAERGRAVQFSSGTTLDAADLAGAVRRLGAPHGDYEARLFRSLAAAAFDRAQRLPPELEEVGAAD